MLSLPEALILYGTAYLAALYGTMGSKLIHAKNMFAGRLISFSVLGFWDKYTGICASAMPYRQNFPTTAR